MEMNDKISKEKRKFERLPIKMPVYYRFDTDSTWRGPVNIDNLGGGGLKMRVKDKVNNNTVLYLKIHLPDGKHPLEFRGEIIWNKTLSDTSIYSLGLKFFKMLPADRQRFIKYISSSILNLYLNSSGEVIKK